MIHIDAIFPSYFTFLAHLPSTDQLLRHAVVETLPIVAGREGLGPLGHQLLQVAAALGLDSQVWTAQSLSAACYWTPTTGWSGNLR